MHGARTLLLPGLASHNSTTVLAAIALPPAPTVAPPHFARSCCRLTRLQKRKEFEDQARRVGRWNPTIWVKYATWEEQQKDFRRARSVWERALETDYR